MTSAEIPPSLLDRYLTGECSPQEAEQVRGWLRTADGHKREFEFLEEIRSVAARTPVWDVRGMWTKLDAAVDADEVSDIRSPRQHVDVTKSLDNNRSKKIGAQPRDRRQAWYVGAAFVAMLLVGTGIWRTLPVGSPYLSRSDERVSVYSTANGERATVTLPDSSIVLLNAGSRVEVSADYGLANRTVRLEGEALFTVIHQSAQPFTVVTPSSVTRVLGTRFVVRHFATDTSTTIAVETGKVAVGSTIVSANQEVVAGAGWVGSVRPLQARRLGFARGILSLDRMPLREAIPELNRWFDADIRIGDTTLNDRVLTGDIRARSAGSLVEIFELVYNLRVVQSGRVLTLYPR